MRQLGSDRLAAYLRKWVESRRNAKGYFPKPDTLKRLRLDQTQDAALLALRKRVYKAVLDAWARDNAMHLDETTRAHIKRMNDKNNPRNNLRRPSADVKARQKGQASRNKLADEARLTVPKGQSLAVGADDKCKCPKHVVCDKCSLTKRTEFQQAATRLETRLHAATNVFMSMDHDDEEHTQQLIDSYVRVTPERKRALRSEWVDTV